MFLRIPLRTNLEFSFDWISWMYVNRITHLTETQMKDTFRRAWGRCCQFSLQWAPPRKSCASAFYRDLFLSPSHLSHWWMLLFQDAYLFWALVPRVYLKSAAGPFYIVVGHRKNTFVLFQKPLCLKNWSHKYGWHSLLQGGGKDEGKLL